MQKIKFPLVFTTCYLVVYAILPYFGGTLAMMLALFLFSPFLVVWMVIRVLKDGIPSDKKFSDGFFYEDKDYRAMQDN